MASSVDRAGLVTRNDPQGKAVDGNYLQPAALSLRAYILPISPIPMSPTTKPSIAGGTKDWGAAIVPKSKSDERRIKTKRPWELFTSSSEEFWFPIPNCQKRWIEKNGCD